MFLLRATSVKKADSIQQLFIFIENLFTRAKANQLLAIATTGCEFFIFIFIFFNGHTRIDH